MGLLSKLLPKKKQHAPSKVVAFLATFIWVNTWLFFPFITFGALWYRFGILYSVIFWGGLGFLAPSLRQNNGLRAFIAKMRFWIDGAEVVGSPAASSGASGSKPALHCHHPHGACAINGCAKGGLDLQIRAVVAPLCFRMPLCRQLMELMGAIPSEKKTFQKYMQSGKDFAVLPGGVEEVVLNDRNKERIYLKKRKGFVKYALELGYDLVPIYHLGETQLYTVPWPQSEDWCVRLRLRIAQKTQLALGWGFGCWWMPNLPRMNQKCITVIGDRVTLPKVERPTPEDVDKYHALYTEKLLELYNQNRHRLPEYKDKNLEIW